MYLIIGASGFIGRHLYTYCRKNGIDVLGTFYSHASDEEWVKFDIRGDNLADILQGRIPEAVIVCGANTSIDGCKRKEEDSFRMNVEGVRRVLSQAESLGSKSVFLSSEAVFDGKRGMYTEEDIPAPVTIYGRQKVQIEQYMIQNLKKYLILRLSRAAGSRYGEKDIFDEFYHKITRQEEIVCLKNQSFCLTEAEDIAKGIVKALQAGLDGLYHLSSDNYISRYELAVLYAEKVFGGYGKITEKEYSELPFYDNRHIYGGLDGKKLAKRLGIRYLDIHRILDKYMSTMP